MDKVYKVPAKRNNKWWSFGKIKVNQFGNLQLSMKNTPELKYHILQGGEWLNFSLFEDNEERASQPRAPQKQVDPRVAEQKRMAAGFDDINDEIPF